MISSILILDYNQKEESKRLLESIKANALFKKKVYFLANGNSEDYAYEYYKDGLIDVLISNKENNGCGFGTMQLFKSCDTKYAFYIQCDQFLQSPITEEHVSGFVKAIEENEQFCYIDLAGDQGHGVYSERGHFISVDFYNSIEKYGGGPGPFHHLEWTEYTMQQYLKNNDLDFLSAKPAPIGNAGKWAVRQNPDGSEWKHRTDTKELWMISPPTEKYVYPKFTEEEWEKVLSSKQWEDGKIPSSETEHSFTCWK